MHFDPTPSSTLSSRAKSRDLVHFILNSVIPSEVEGPCAFRSDAILDSVIPNAVEGPCDFVLYCVIPSEVEGPCALRSDAILDSVIPSEVEGPCAFRIRRHPLLCHPERSRGTLCTSIRRHLRLCHPERSRGTSCFRPSLKTPGWRITIKTVWSGHSRPTLLTFRSTADHVGADALTRPVERSSTLFDSR